MTSDQWNTFEESMPLAPPEAKIMYNNPNGLTQGELVALTNTLLVVSETFQHLGNQPEVNQRTFNEAAELMNTLLAAMYGRLMGLAKQYDLLVTKQVLLEAELASTGK